MTLAENLADPQRWNRYAYVRNNPLRFTDPDGRCVKSSDATRGTSASDICKPTADLKADSLGQLFVKDHEKFDSKVYPDTAQNPTVGYGHLVVPADNLKLGDTISDEQGATFFSGDVLTSETAVRRGVGSLELSQNEFNALTDLAFNVGPGVFNAKTSPLLSAAIAAGDYAAMAEQVK